MTTRHRPPATRGQRNRRSCDLLCPSRARSKGGSEVVRTDYTIAAENFTTFGLTNRSKSL
jgi:hypothetical protein